MKEIKIERTVFDTVYEAVDGTIFDDKSECQKYDKSAGGVLKGKLVEMSLRASNEEDLLNTGSCETKLYTAVPKNEQDLDKLRQIVIAFGGGQSSVSKITNDLICRVVLVYIGYDDDWVYIDTLDQLVNRLTGDKWIVTEV